MPTALLDPPVSSPPAGWRALPRPAQGAGDVVGRAGATSGRAVGGDGHLGRPLLLATATGSVTLFPAGRVDPLGVFQRAGVSRTHELEYVVRAAAGEALQAVGAFDLRRPLARLPLPWSPRAERGWRRFLARHDLTAVPSAEALLSRALGAYRPRDPAGPGAGRNHLGASRRARPAPRRRGEPLAPGALVALLCRELRGPHWVAWAEEAIAAPGVGDELVHRYYLRRDGLFLVRHDGAAGKWLFRARQR